MIIIQEKFVLFSFVGSGSVIAYLTGHFTPIIYIMLIFSIFDYFIELAVSIKIGVKINSDIVFWNFVKKIFYFVLIGVAFGFDFLIHEKAVFYGSGLEWGAYFGVLSITYLVVTEGISILENLEEFDIKVPFLTEGLKSFREKIQSKKK